MKRDDRDRLQEWMKAVEEAKRKLYWAADHISDLYEQELTKFENLSAGLKTTDMGEMLLQATLALQKINESLVEANDAAANAMREYDRTPALSHVELHAGNNGGVER